MPGCDQVYKGRLRKDGRVVAVKVQRPRVREAIALDIFILRRLAGYFGTWRKLNRYGQPSPAPPSCGMCILVEADPTNI